MAMSLSFCRTRTTDKSKHMSHTHAAARSFDLARHPSRCETVELSNREVLDSSTVSQQQHGAKRHCVGFLTTQAFFPPPNKVAKRLSVSQTSCLQASRMRALHYRNSLSYRRAPEFGAQAQYHTVSKPKPVSHSLRRGLFDLSQRVDKHRGDA